MAVLVVVLGVALGACSNDEPEDAAPPATTTTSPPTTTTTATPMGLPTPEAAARALMTAWAANDRPAALVVATAAAVDSLFATPFAPPAPQFRSCDLGQGTTSDCAFRYGDNLVQVRATTQPPGGWRVAEVTIL
jgi:hypothetical protein